MGNPFLDSLWQTTTEDEETKLAYVAALDKIASDAGMPLSDEQVAELQDMPQEDLEGLYAQYQGEEGDEGGEEITEDDAQALLEYYQQTGDLPDGFEFAEADEEGDEYTAADELGLTDEQLAAMGFDKESSADLLLADSMGRRAAHEYAEAQLEKLAVGALDIETAATARGMSIKDATKLYRSAQTKLKAGKAMTKAEQSFWKHVQGQSTGRGGLRAAATMGNVGKKIPGKIPVKTKLLQLLKGLGKYKVPAAVGAGGLALGALAGRASGGREAQASGYEAVVTARAQELAEYLNKTAEADEVQGQIDDAAVQMLVDHGYDVTPLFEE